MKLLLVFGVLLALVASCNKAEMPLPQEEARSYTYFEKNLKTNMDYQALINQFGAPTKDIGSGIHIYVYVLNDATEIWIGYTDKILYARHMDKNRQVIKTLL